MATGSVWQRLTGEKPSKPGLWGRLREEHKTHFQERTKDRGHRSQTLRGCFMHSGGLLATCTWFSSI